MQSLHSTSGDVPVPSHGLEMYCPAYEPLMPARQLCLQGAHVVSTGVLCVHRTLVLYLLGPQELAARLVP